MKIKLECSKNYIPYLEDRLTQSGFTIDEKGPVMIIDNPLIKHQQLEDFHAIIFIESFGSDLHIHQVYESEPIIVQDKLYLIEEKHKAHGFIRVNKSQIVNIRFIKNIEPWIGQKYLLTMSNGKLIDVNRTYYKKFKSYLQL